MLIFRTLSHYSSHHIFPVKCRVVLTKSPSSLFPPKFLILPKRRYSISSVSATANANSNKRSTFYADGTISWESLGVSDALHSSLRNAGLHRPSLIQADCIPKISSGNDVTIAAETGSGKTHGYLVPLVDKLLREQIYTNEKDNKIATHPWFCLILCPNTTLCEQVVRMANSLCGGDGQPLVRTTAFCGRQGWPLCKPHIIVSTPVSLLNTIDATDPKKGRDSHIIQGVKSVVFDEADMLISGSLQNKVVRLINMLRLYEKKLSRKKGPRKSYSDSTIHSEIDERDNLHHVETEDVEDDDEHVEDDDHVEDNDHVEEDANKRVGTIRRKRWSELKKSYRRSKQYIFVAATLPTNGKKTSGGILKQMFPDSLWINGNYLHYHSPRLMQKWVEINVDTQVDALIEAVKCSLPSEILDSGDGVSRTIVFANTVASVESVTKILRASGNECLCYHCHTSPEERVKILDEFREIGGIIVCTDAAARGVDIPNVLHVIQAEFASSAIAFLHRTGRTARAGGFGLVTNMYSESNRDLVVAVRQAEKLGCSVESVFSRNRSFRKKMKKKGSVDGVAPSRVLQDTCA